MPHLISAPFETAIHGTLRNFVADLRALEDALVKAGDRLRHEDILRLCDDTAEFFNRMRATLQDHVARLDRVIGERDEALPRPGTSTPFVTDSFAAAKAPFRDACSLMCDYFSQLNLVAIGYTMLHARSVALHDTPTAKLALAHLQDVVSLVHLLREAGPRLAVQELSRHFGGLTPHAAETAVRLAQETWAQNHAAESVH
jgi:hypothetical protein